MISVVLPVRNGAATIAVQLEALARQTFAGRWELVVVDDGSTDGTAAIVESFSERIGGLRVVRSSGDGSRATARNTGVGATTGEMLAFCDADDVVSERWLQAHVDSLHDADVVAGRRMILVDGRISDMPVNLEDRPLAGFLPFADTCNLSVRRSALEAVGGFDPSFRASSDVDFSWRAQVAGFRFAVAPEAIVGKSYGDRLGPSRRQTFEWRRAEARLYRRFREHGMSRESLLHVGRAWGALVLRVPLLWRPEYRAGWGREAARRLGSVVGSIENRVLYL